MELPDGRLMEDEPNRLVEMEPFDSLMRLPAFVGAVCILGDWLLMLLLLAPPIRVLVLGAVTVLRVELSLPGMLRVPPKPVRLLLLMERPWFAVLPPCGLFPLPGP